MEPGILLARLLIPTGWTEWREAVKCYKMECVVLCLMLFGPACAASSAFAAEPAAPGAVTAKQPVADMRCTADGEFCECEKDISRLNITPPEGMSLVSVDGCRRVTATNSMIGNFYFKGAVTLSGDVVRKDSAIFGDSIVWFNVRNAAGYNQLRFTDDSFVNVSSKSAAIRKFKLPRLSGKSACWAAHAQIKIRAIKVIADLGTDYAGSYPTEFEVLNVGPYSRCEAQ